MKILKKILKALETDPIKIEAPKVKDLGEKLKVLKDSIKEDKIFKKALDNALCKCQY